MKKELESQIQKSIIEWLEWKKVFHYRQNSGAFKTELGGFYRMGISGAPDIICVVRGRFIGLEVKTKSGKLNPNQEAFKNRLEKAKGIYAIVRSLDEAKEVLNTCA